MAFECRVISVTCTQLKVDFTNGKLKHQLANSAGLQMAAIDMVMDMKITGRKIGDGNIT